MAFLLGLVGYLRAGGLSLASAVYRSLGLFTLSFDPPPNQTASGLPLTLEIARFLAPAVTVLAAAAVAARVFRDEFDRQTTRRRVRGHVVVCGLGSVGAMAAQQLRAQGRHVVAIERDRSRPSIPAARSAGIPVVVGDARARQTLRRAGVDQAAHLVWSASDWADGQAVVDSLVDTLNGRSEKRHGAPRGPGVPACTVRDLALSTTLRLRALSQHPEATWGPDVDYFNLAENTAQRLLWKVTRGYALFDGGQVELWLLGSGPLVEALVVQAARNWWGVPSDHARPTLLWCISSMTAPRVHATTSSPDGLRSPSACCVEAHDGPPEGALEVSRSTDAIGEPQGAFVLTDDPERAVHLGLHLAEETAIPMWWLASSRQPRQGWPLLTSCCSTRSATAWTVTSCCSTPWTCSAG